MFRTIVEQTYRCRARLPLRRRASLRARLMVTVAGFVALLAIAAMYAPQSARSNLALCLKATAAGPSPDGKTGSREAISTAIERCLD